MLLHIHKQLIDQVDLIALLQEFMAVNNRRCNFFGKKFVLHTVISVDTREHSHIASSEF